MFLKVEFIALYVISSSKDLWIEDFWEQDGEWNSKSGKFSIKAFYSFFALKDSNVFQSYLELIGPNKSGIFFSLHEMQLGKGYWHWTN